MLAQRPGSPTRMVASPAMGVGMELGGNSLAQAAAAAATTGSVRTGLPTMQGMPPSAVMQGMQGLQGTNATLSAPASVAQDFPRIFPGQPTGMPFGAASSLPTQARGVGSMGSVTTQASGGAPPNAIGVAAMQGVPGSVQVSRTQTPQSVMAVPASGTSLAGYQQAQLLKPVEENHRQSARQRPKDAPRTKSSSPTRGRGSEGRRGDAQLSLSGRVRSHSPSGSRTPPQSPGRTLTESKSRIFDDLYQDAASRAKRREQRERDKEAKERAQAEKDQREHEKFMKKLKSNYKKGKEIKIQEGHNAHLGREAAFQLWRDKRRQQRAEWYQKRDDFEEMAECTFHPSIYTSSQQRAIAETRLGRIQSERQVLKLPPETPPALKAAACRLTADELELAVPSRPNSPGRGQDQHASTATLDALASSEVGGTSTPIPETSLPPGVFDHSRLDGAFNEPLQALLDAKLRGTGASGRQAVNVVNGVAMNALHLEYGPGTPSAFSRVESQAITPRVMTPGGGMTPRGGTTPRSRTASAAALGSAILINDSNLTRHQAALSNSLKGSLTLPLGGSSLASPTASVSHLAPAASLGSGVMVGTPRSGNSHPATPRSQANSTLSTNAGRRHTVGTLPANIPTMADQVQKSTPKSIKSRDENGSPTRAGAPGVLDTPASQEGFLQALQAVQELRERNVLLNEQNAELAEALDERQRMSPVGMQVSDRRASAPFIASSHASSAVATPRQQNKAPVQLPPGALPQQQAVAGAMPMAIPVGANPTASMPATVFAHRPSFTVSPTASVQLGTPDSARSARRSSMPAAYVPPAQGLRMVAGSPQAVHRHSVSQ